MFSLYTFNYVIFAFKFGPRMKQVYYRWLDPAKYYLAEANIIRCNYKGLATIGDTLLEDYGLPWQT